MCRALLSALLSLTFALITKADEPPSPIELVRIWPSWRDNDSFLRISEYFGGGENRNRQTILRTQAAERSGFYFLTRIKNEGTLLSDAHFELQVIHPDSPHPLTYRFPVTLATGSHVYNLGITGSDWHEIKGKSAEETHPVAWALRLLDVKGHELVHSESFLWGKSALK